jgi:hypothetical protein
VLSDLVVVALSVLMGVVLIVAAYATGEDAGYRQALEDVAERDAALEASRDRVRKRLAVDEAERALREDGGQWR